MPRTSYLALCLPILLCTTAAAETVYETLDHPFDGVWFNERPGDMAAQPFILGENDTITSVTIGMGRNGNPGGTLHIDIYNDDGTGVPGTSVGRVGSTDPNTVAPNGDNYSFDGVITNLIPNDPYYVVVSHEGSTFTSNNRVSWGMTRQVDRSGAGEAIVKTARIDWHTIRSHPEGGPPFRVYAFASVDALMAIEGDFDFDGELSASDIDALTMTIVAQRGKSQFDLNSDGAIDLADHAYWVKNLKKSWFGDANLDGEFSSEDMVEVFQTGLYELDMDAVWSEGDWTGDRRFDSGDLVAAFQDGGYELGAHGAVRAVPEPASFALLLIGTAVICRLRRRR